MLEFNFSPFPEIQTERLVLRRITQEDAPVYFKLRTQPKVMEYLDRFPPSSIDEIYNLIARIDQGIANNESIAWAITEKGNPEFIGAIGFHQTDSGNHRAEIGYQLLTEYWNKGIISEAMKAVIEFGFTKMKLHSIMANVNPNNAASIQVLLKHNFIKEAHFKEDYYFDGKFLDSVIFSLLNKNDQHY